MMLKHWYEPTMNFSALWKKYWTGSDPLTTFWVSRFKQNTNIPIVNHFPGLPWKSLVPGSYLKKIRWAKVREYSKEKRIKYKTKQNNTKKPSMTHRLPQWQFHSILQSHCGTFLTVFMNKKILFSIQSCQKKRKQFWLWKHCCEF